MPKKIIQITIILIAVFAINFSLASLRADIYKKEGKESLEKNFPYIAVDKFNKALELDGSNGEVRGYLGIAYTNLSERNKDIELLKKAVYEIKNALKTHEDPSINYHLAKTYELSGDIDSAIQEAIKSYNQIPSGQTKDKLIDLYKIKGDAHLAQNRKDEAIKFYKKFVELKGVNATNGDVADYEFFRDLMPDNFLIRYNLGNLYINQNLWEKAVIEMEHIKKTGIFNEDILSKLIESYYKAGYNYFKEKKFKEAEGYLKSIINLDSSGKFIYTVYAIHLLSTLYEEIGQIDKAVDILMKLEGIDTQKGQGYYLVGYLFARKSNPKKAIVYYEQYLPFRSISDSNIFIMMGGLYEQVGDINNAIIVYSKLENINSFKGKGHYYIGLIYEKGERWSDAIKEFEYVLEINPKNSQILLKIGQLYEKIGNNRKALEIYKNVIAIDPTKELDLQIVRLYEKIGNREKALSQFKKGRILETL